jgi:lipoteichoic acid synthase
VKASGKVKSIAMLVAWITLAGGVLATAWPRDSWALIKSRLINSQAIERMGFGGYLVFDTIDTAKRWWQLSRLENLDPAPFREFLAANAARAHNPTAPGRGQGKHVVYLQLESMDGLVIGARHNGQPVMPFLESLARDNVYFANALDNTASGRTTDGEFMVLTSQVPLTRPPVFVSQALDKIPSMPKLLRAEGYQSVSLHGFNGVFWHRAKAHEALGYDRMIFEDDLTLTEKIGWGWADQEVLPEAVEMLRASEQPLLLHVITLTNHHPYDYLSKRAGREPGTIAEEYLRSIRYVDDALAQFFAALDEAGLRDECLIVIYGDHDSAVTGALDALLETHPPRLHPDTIPMVMVGFDRPSRRVDRLAGLQDVPVMVLEELGIEVPTTFLGNGWDRWGRTRSAQHGAWQSTASGLVDWPWPVDSHLLTLMAINHPEKLTVP